MKNARTALIVTELDPTVYPQPAYLASSMAELFGSATLLTLSNTYTFRAGEIPPLRAESQIPSYRSLSALMLRACHHAAAVNPTAIIAVNEPLLPLLPMTIPFAPAAIRGAYLLDYWEDTLVTQTLRLKAAHRIVALGTRWLDFLIECQAERLALRGWAVSPRINRFVLHNMPPLNHIPATLQPKTDGVRPRIIYAGAGGVGAFIEPILEAIASLESQVEGRFFLRAPAHRLEELRTFAQSLNLADRVTIAPEIAKSELLAELAQADIGLCFYSTGEMANVNTRLCSPNKLYEYIALGVAPLVSPNPTLRFVEKNGIGLCAEGSDAEDIACGLRTMIEGRRYAEMGQSAREAFLEERFYEAEFTKIADYLRAESGL